MSNSKDVDPNKHQYEAGLSKTYLSTRLLTHNGITIAFALGRIAQTEQLFFDYSILNAADQEPGPSATQERPDFPETTEKLDSQCWSENVKTLRFPSEMRVVGEEAVPVFKIPTRDSTGLPLSSDESPSMDPWVSTSLGLMNPKVTHFEVLSDGRYIYLFRQSRASSDSFPNPPDKPDPRSKAQMPPIDDNLLCDRFNLVGTTLSRSLEVRYRRSRQKRLPLNERDTLGVQDIDDVPFYEPTFVLRFLKNLIDGRFTVLQTPTMTNEMKRWMFFTLSGPNQIDCFTTDTAADGLFDTHGQKYYTCNAEHESVFSNAPGACTALSKRGENCGEIKRVIVPKATLSDRAISLYKNSANTTLSLDKPISLSTFSDGFTLEAWIVPASFWIDSSAKIDRGALSGEATGTPAEQTRVPAETPSTEGRGGEPANLPAIKPPTTEEMKEMPSQAVLPPPGSTFCLFSILSEQKNSLSVFLDDRFRVVLRTAGDTPVLLASEQSVEVNTWNHVAISYIAASRTFTLIVNGTAPSTKCSYILPDSSSLGSLTTLASHLGEHRFQGRLDEVRLWKHALHPATIKSNLSTRATGLEPLLEACWHFDEGTGTRAYDATSNGHDINIVQATPTTPLPTKLWAKSTAPMASNIGLSRRTLRLGSNTLIVGGIGAGLYHEQLSVINADASNTKKEETKPLKRGARVLLTFIAKKSTADAYLAVIDLALMSDGTLCDVPAILPMPTLSLTAKPNMQGVKRVTTTKLHVDAQGMEIFGGILEFDAARCGTTSPSVWDSATGSISIFFQSNQETFSALTYDVTRAVELNTITGLCDSQCLQVANKLRQAVNIEIQTSSWEFAPESIAVNLQLTASLEDGSKVSESWKGVPSDLGSLCNLLNGQDVTPPRALGTLANFKSPAPSLISDDKKVEENLLTLAEKLKIAIAPASCITVSGRHFQVLKPAAVGDVDILLSKPYGQTDPLVKLKRGLQVNLLGYDHGKLVTCVGKPIGDFSQGSSILSIAYSDGVIEASEKNARVVSAGNFQFTPSSPSPSFSSPAPSTALKLSKDEVYSMLEDTVDTAASSGITFESWIKVEELSETVIAAYKSQRTPRSVRTDPEQQTFILGIRQATQGRSGHDLICNANGSLFSINNPDALKVNQWMHFACSSRNAFALKFTGSNYVNLSAAPEFNVSDFSLAFTLQIDKLGGDQIVFAKSASDSSVTPLHLTITPSGALSLSYYAQNEEGFGITKRQVVSKSTLSQGVPYKVFVSRKHVRVTRKDAAPRAVQCVTVLAWRTDGSLCIEFKPPSIEDLERSEARTGTIFNLTGDGPAQASGLAQPSESPLTVGGSAWASGSGLNGSIGAIRFFSSALQLPLKPTAFCTPTSSEKSSLGAWSFRDAGGVILKDDTGRNHGKLKNDPDWILSKYEPDHQHFVYINGYRKSTENIAETTALKAPAGRHQLTLGNCLHGDETTRFLAMPNSFQGQFDELRIWNVPRTKENITDAMNSRLSEVPTDMAVYLPFDDPEGQGTTIVKDIGFLADASNNCWHLTPLHESKQLKVSSEAPVSHDAPCVRHVLSPIAAEQVVKTGVQTTAAPAVAEYGDMQISATGGMEGSYKRVYSYIEKDGKWSLITGFKIGSLITEWVSQVQTNPTLIGYIEGAPPIPAENYIGKDDRPSSAVKFMNAQKCTYTYSSRGEIGADLDLTVSAGIGAKWQVSAGMGVETEMTAGEVKTARKLAVNVSGAQINNSVSTATTNTNLEMRVELTGAWTPREGATLETYEAANTGLALVESEVADVFALRLKVRGPVAPLVAYQMRPNPDIPKDRNLVSFPINNSYTKQGCLDGRRGLKEDVDYPPSSEAPTDASYYKPREAYALKDRIRRQEEQLAGEFERTKMYAIDRSMAMPSRTHRNICNSYVWTADGGTFQETTSTMDMVQTEIGGQLNFRGSVGASLDMEVSAGNVLATCNVDALISAHTNLTQTKEVSSETNFELQTDLPPAVDIRSRDSNGKLVKRPGAVDAYRWMSFWLEGSVEATDAFFQQVVDPKWLDDGQEANSKLLLKLRDQLRSQPGNARTKAWRVLHRCTYISRVPEPIAAKPKMELQSQVEKKSTLLADVPCNWHIIQNLEPLVRGAQSRPEIAHLAQAAIAKLYPAIRAQPRFYGQLLDLLGDYIGLP